MHLHASMADFREMLERSIRAARQMTRIPADREKLVRAEREYRTIIGIIDSMTQAERDAPIATVDSSRLRRIARGAGVPDQQVIQFLINYNNYIEMIGKHNFHERNG